MSSEKPNFFEKHYEATANQTGLSTIDGVQELVSELLLASFKVYQFTREEFVYVEKFVNVLSSRTKKLADDLSVILMTPNTYVGHMDPEYDKREASF